MTKPLNYCRAMTKQVKNCLHIPGQDENIKADARQMFNIVAAAQKFVLPEHGLLLDDSSLRAIDVNKTLRLPYPAVVLEFEGGPAATDGWGISKSIITAVEYTPTDICPMHIGVSGAYFDVDKHGWVPLPTHVLDARSAERSPQGIHTLSTLASWGATPLHPDLERHFEGILANYSYIVLSFLNALACSNVHTQRVPVSPIHKAMNSARPYDEYYVLTVDVTSKTRSGIGASREGRHPREHLRRGHIRVCASGLTIFVNACVVAAGTLGKITKDYALRRAA